MRLKNTIVVNMFGGPGTGKSTTSAKVFSILKDRNIDSELITEFAKDLVWADRINTFDDDIYVFAKQNHRMFNVNGKVDVLVTDSPLPLKLVYMRSDLPMDTLVMATFNHYNNINFFLQRYKKYNPNGRLQKTEAEAIEVDKKILNMLEESKIPYEAVKADKDCASTIADIVLKLIHPR